MHMDVSAPFSAVNDCPLAFDPYNFDFLLWVLQAVSTRHRTRSVIISRVYTR